MGSKFGSLIERKIVQWSLAYLAAAWATLEAVGFLADVFAWPQTVVRATTVLLGAGLLAVIVVSWFHGERGRQRATRTEAGLLTVIAALGIMGVVLIAPPPETSTEAPELSLAVLPPTGLPGQSSQEHFLTGTHEALNSQLAQVGALRVISRRSTVKYAGSDASIPEIAEELGVDAIVEASVGRSGDSAQLQLRLIQAVPDERLLWAATFRAPMRNVLAMHGDAARGLVREVEVDLDAAQEARLASAPAVDPETYEAYLRGMHAISLATPGDREQIQEGLGHLHEAVRRDPADALAYAGLALGYATLGHGFAPPVEAWPRAREAARRAIALDPDLAEAHAALADVKLYYEWDWEGAEAAFQRANELNPSLAMNHYHYAWFLALMGRLDQAIEEHQLARTLDPLFPVHTAWLGELYIMDGRPEEAVAVAREAMELAPDFPPAHTVLGNAYLAMGRVDSAIAVHRRLAAMAPPTVGTLGKTLALAGRAAEARHIRDELASQEPTPWLAWQLANLNAALGDYDRAFRWIDHRPHHAFLPWIAVDDRLEGLRDDPRFDDFLRRLDLPERHPRLALP